MINPEERICIIGAGLAGTLFSIYLAQRGIHSDLFEKRLDMRKAEVAGGRSIVMSLSERGWAALRDGGLENQVKQMSIAKHARYVHNRNGSDFIQYYGSGEQAVYSINRKKLNSVLLDKAESTGLVDIYFNCRFEGINLDEGKVTFFDMLNQKNVTRKYDHIISADGIFSRVRNEIADYTNQSPGLTRYNYVYKELIIPSTENDDWALSPNYIHVWPRKNCFFVAMPNCDKTFTCTLFYPSSGLPEVNIQDDEEELHRFFDRNFTEIIPLIPDLVKEFHSRKVSDMYSVRTGAWYYRDKVLILGDAAHAIVPFYGMGMNVAFEDCRILNNLIDEYNFNWEKIFAEFYNRRKPEADGIAALSLKNLSYLEYSDDDADLKWKLERKLWKLFPEKWTPAYVMVAFTHMPFTKIIEVSSRQNRVMDILLSTEELRNRFMNEDYQKKLYEIASSYICGINDPGRNTKMSDNELHVLS